MALSEAEMLKEAKAAAFQSYPLPSGRCWGWGLAARRVGRQNFEINATSNYSMLYDLKKF